VIGLWRRCRCLDLAAAAVRSVIAVIHKFWAFGKASSGLEQVHARIRRQQRFLGMNVEPDASKIV
jgi:hypothetical protein